ncbi:GIY-YIG nuclease family protein [Nocardioides lentus]|uniref:GIY-YIG nuclease family protein n=1 Tax=Nocardioides lentus TaxID=338077 RepID=A0ABN2NZA0_9ACTN
MPYAYMLRCRDGSYYVGSTWDLDRRVADHNLGQGLGAAYTSSRRPVVLVWSQHFDRIEDAFAFEKRVQGWGRAKREALIRGDWDAISALARRRSVREREAVDPG